MLPKESIFTAALRGCNVDVAARRDFLWDATVCLQADVLRTLDLLRRGRPSVLSDLERQAGSLPGTRRTCSAWRRSQNSRIRLIGG
jgi:hypothetical protein